MSHSSSCSGDASGDDLMSTASNEDALSVGEEYPSDATTYQEFLQKELLNESNEIDDAIEDESGHPSDDCAEVMVDGVISDNKMAEMRSVFVTDPDGNLIHKKALLKSLNIDKSLKKSFDRTKRVRDQSRTGNSMKDSAVTRAFQYSHDTGDYPNSGSDRLCTGDFCCVFIKPSKNGRAHMVVGKFQRFGHVH